MSLSCGYLVREAAPGEFRVGQGGVSAVIRFRASHTISAILASCSASSAMAETDTSSARARLVIFAHVGLRTPRSMPDR